MATLSTFRVDSKAIEAGEWMAPGEEFDDLKLRVRGFGDEYYDDQAAQLRRAARQYGGEISRVPNAVQRAIRVDCLVKHVFLDVQNLKTDAGETVGAEQFRDLMRNPDHGDLVVAVMRAASMVGRVRGAELEDASGN